MVELWKKNLLNQSTINKILKPIKKTYLVLIFLFFSALIITLPAIQDFNQIGFHFNNPIIFANAFNSIEKLPERSLIVGYDGRESLLHTDTHFYPYGKKLIETL